MVWWINAAAVATASIGGFYLEHFPIWRNRGGFPSAANSDSCLGLAEEASPHGQASFERSA